MPAPAPNVIRATLNNIVLGLTAAGELPDGEVPWRAVLCVEDAPTADFRLLQGGAIDWRDLPLALMGLIETGWGHDGALLCGKIENVTREGSDIVGSGVFDSGEFGREIARLVYAEFLTGVSVDLAVAEAEVGLPDNPDASDAEVEEALWNGEPVLYIVTKGTILGATVCPFPAFAEARIEVLDAEPAETDAEAVAAAGMPQIGVHWRVTGGFHPLIGKPKRLERTAVTAGLAPEVPPADWFSDPELDRPTPLTITDEGRVFGHVASWDSCHEGYSDRCVRPPQCSASGGAFMLGGCRAADDNVYAVGQITMRTSHPDLHASADDTRRHYDHTGLAVADVAYGEDAHGPWIAGSIRPTLTEADVRELRAAKLSGDWRPDGNGGLKLVGILAVNVPGFPIPRPRALAAAATPDATHLTPTAIVAANIVTRCGCEDEADRSASIARMVRVAREGRSAVVASLAAQARGE